MKKILSVLIAVAMLLSAITVSVLPTVAADDDEYSASNDEFIISTAREDLFMEDDDRTSRPGGVYTSDGFSVNPLDPEYSEYKVTWPNNAPYVNTQVKANLAYQGFFMEVRVDDFSFWNVTEGENGEKTYSYTDRWFSFSVWDSVGVMPAQLGTDSEGKDWGNGIEMLVRLNPGSEYKNNPDPESYTYISGIQWYDDTESVKPNTRYDVGGTPAIPAGSTYENTVIGSDGKLYLTFEIRYDENTESWTPYINGVKAPVTGTGKDVLTESLTAMLWGECSAIDENLDQYEAYVGFSIQSAQRDAACSFTITKIGTSSTDYYVPTGDENDRIEAKQRDNAVADVEPRDPDSDPAEPVLLMTGDPDSYKSVRSVSGAAKFANLENGNLQIVSNNGAADPLFRPFNEQSYDLRDYPSVAIIVKNFCTCEWTDTDWDGNPDPYCTHSEKVTVNYTAGDYPNSFGSSGQATKVTDLEYTDADGNTYSVYIYDFTERMETEGFTGEQRIHGVYAQYWNIKLDLVGRNTFEMVAMAHFANEDGAFEWADAYLEDNIKVEEDTTEETDAPETTAPDTSDVPEGPELPDPDSELTIKDAYDLGVALGNGNYTDGWYYVYGTVVEVIDPDTGKMTIVDEDGNTIVISALYNDTGDVAYNELSEQPVAGDWIYVYGAIGCSEGEAEVKDAWLMVHEPAATPDETETTEPTTPDTTEPTTPETTEPTTPETTEPTTPETTEPTTPETTEPTTPETTEPTTPETTEPTTPETTEPATPDTTEPATPDTTEPATPDTTEPATPDTTEPTTPDTTEITTPDTTEPTTPDTTEPTTPDTTEPTTPDTTEPATPDTTEPTTPDTTEPTTPNTTEPTTPDTTEPVSKPAQTEPKDEPTTEAPKTEVPNRGGCGSVAGFGALAIVAVAAIGLVSFKKKED